MSRPCPYCRAPRCAGHCDAADDARNEPREAHRYHPARPCSCTACARAPVVHSAALVTWRRVAAFRTAQWLAAAACVVALDVAGAGDAEVAAWCDAERDAAWEAQDAALDRDVREGRWAMGAAQ